jgi:hypothetical protein
LKVEVLHIILWKTHFERAIVSQTTKCMNEWMFTKFRTCTLFQGKWLYSIFLRTVTFTTISKSFSIYTFVSTSTYGSTLYGFHVQLTWVRRSFPNSSSSSTEQKKT